MIEGGRKDFGPRGEERAARAAAESVITGRVGLVTLVANVASTTLTVPLIRSTSAIVFMPTTANAAAELGAGTMYIVEATRVNGSAIIVHANNAQTDRTFRYFIA